MSIDQTKNSSESALSADQILRGLRSLSEELARQGIIGEICLFGGAVMVLAFAARLTTKDVDGIFQPTTVIREIARRIAEEQQLPANWLNDGVKGFLSARHETTSANLPQFKNLRLTVPVPEYLLAMKCMAARIGGTQGEVSDVPDILFLIRNLGLKSAAEVLDLVSQYYPQDRIPVKTQYLIEGLFEEGKV
jgi:predicted nucleotidyltransferase